MKVNYSVDHKGLDRLVVLLDTASTVTVRNTAAAQLAEIQKNYPHELYPLLARVVPLLRSSNWDTRVAAAKALGGIVDNVVIQNANNQCEADSNVENSLEAENAEHEYMKFESLDILNIMKKGKSLLGSAGKEYNAADVPFGDEYKRKQQRVLARRLGLGSEYMSDDLISSSDIKLEKAVVVDPSGSDYLQSPLSARQKNIMKRKLKTEVKQAANKSRMLDLVKVDNLAATEVAQSIKAAEFVEGSQFAFTSQSRDRMLMEAQHDSLGSSNCYTIWPFEGVCDLLLFELFEPNWEIRHGSAMGLREIFRAHGSSCAYDLKRSAISNLHQCRFFQEDAACRFVCVLALDRFGDYVSDQVVTPVRESVAQALGALLFHLPTCMVEYAVNALLQLVFQNNEKHIWQACHGGMVGLRYAIAVRSEVIFANDLMLNQIIDAVKFGLESFDDDVKAVAASMLIPVTGQFISARPKQIPYILNAIWESLADLNDDLNASTGSVMDFLAKLCTFPDVLVVMARAASIDPAYSFSKLIPSLYPFLRHTIPLVRLAVLNTLHTLLGVNRNYEEWVDTRMLRLLLQNLLVERSIEILDLTLSLWSKLINVLSDDYIRKSCLPFIDPIFRLFTTPVGGPRNHIGLDLSLYIRPKSNYAAMSSVSKMQRSTSGFEDFKFSVVDAPMLKGEIDIIGIPIVIRTRAMTAIAIGQLLSHWPQSHLMTDFEELYYRTLVTALNPWTRLFAGISLQEHAEQSPDSQLIKSLYPFLLSLLDGEEANGMDYIHYQMEQILCQCKKLQKLLQCIYKGSAQKLPLLYTDIEDQVSNMDHFSLEIVSNFVGERYDKLKRLAHPSKSVIEMQNCDEIRVNIIQLIDETKSIQASHVLRVSSTVAAIMVSCKTLPKKLNPVVQAIMNSIKMESNSYLQRRSAHYIANLVKLCTDTSRNNVADKIAGNLCSYLCIGTCDELLQEEYGQLEDRAYTSICRSKQTLMLDTTNEKVALDIAHNGAFYALQEICRIYGEKITIQLPKIQERMSDGLAVFEQQKEESSPHFRKRILDSLNIVSRLVQLLHHTKQKTILEFWSTFVSILTSETSVLRYAASLCLAKVCKAMHANIMELYIKELLVRINDSLVRIRQGVTESIYHLIKEMDHSILPYLIFLIVPVLGRMSDSDEDVRLLATESFAALVKLIPLESAIPDPPGISTDLLQNRDEERKFIGQMLDGSKIEQFRIPVDIKADLRKYQQEGVNWLAFLNRYQLHGILCDDMGLGKTLQTICIIASDHHNRSITCEKTNAHEMRKLPSLVICPPTLTGHWEQEISHYAKFLKTLIYAGPVHDRQQMHALWTTMDIVITSYDVCRNDISYLSQQQWNYCVLDEGHVIKNSKTRLTVAVKTIKAFHRLILSGTPIQNNVVELWSLFDFLMPGFLGSEANFYEKFAKPIAASRDSKCTSKEQEAGALALEALHKQVTPFLLRRLKEDVLADLPPKIIQDYYCDLSYIQLQLYEEFTKIQTPGLLNQELCSDKKHVFQALQYMRKLCNHPALILQPNHPKYSYIMSQLAHSRQSIRDLSNAPKLGALRDLLLDCGIGVNNDEATLSALSQHRALIFCQQKDMLNMIEEDLLRKTMPSVTFLRLDGGVEASKRQGIVQKFNDDPSIDVLLLTTHVGGLGLNLTGADTVIFVEHDWNPMKDLQAMDRAHRLGQKKVVNVYRLITRGTLEEKIMGLQRFKMQVASSVINQQNSSLASMNTDDILDLFSPPQTETISKVKQEHIENIADEVGEVNKKKRSNMLDDLSELWDENQYQEEYNIDGFLSSLRSQQSDM